jgi:hypothetical protein
MDKSLFDYEQFRNAHGGEFRIDFSDNSRQQYKESNGIKLYKNGQVHIQPRAYRDPRLRKHLRVSYGLDIRLMSEFQGYRFKLPDGTPVSKGDIDSGVYLLDSRYMKLFSLAHWRDALRLYGPDAQLMPDIHSEVQMRIPNVAKVDELLRRAPPDTLALARSFYAMTEGTGRPNHPRGALSAWFHGGYEWPVFLVGETALPENDNLRDLLFELGWALHHKTLRSELLTMSRRNVTAPYLLAEDRTNRKLEDLDTMH